MTEASGVCEFCGEPGARDMRALPNGFHKQGRRNQGAMTPQYSPAEYSPTLGAVCCVACFQQRFYTLKGAAA
jgi:hypothetical protein